MLSQEARALLIKTQETIHNAAATAKIFGVSKSTVYARIRDYCSLTRKMQKIDTQNTKKSTLCKKSLLKLKSRGFY